MLSEALILKGLSTRESEVAALVCKGLPNKLVADKLFVTEKTIKFHLTNIYKKMQVKSRAQLIVWSASHLDFIEPSKDLTPQSPAATEPAGETMPVGIQNKI